MPFYIQYPGLWIGLLKGALWISLPCSETLKHTVWMERYAEVKCFIPFDIQWFYRSLRCPWRYKMVSKRKILWGANSCGHRKDVFKNLYLASSLSFSVETSNTTIMAHTLFGFFFLDKLVKQRSTGTSSKSGPLTWVDVLSLPLPTNKDGHHTKTHKEDEQHRWDKSLHC